MKIVINACFGGFGLSDEAFELYLKKKGMERIDNDIPRDDLDLIKVVEELGDKANGCCAELKIVEIPDNIKWEINEYDGSETIDECHRSWG